MAREPVTARDAATVVLLRDRPQGPEALMLRRPGEADFAAHAWVFPGGAVDPEDRALDPERWTGIDPEALVRRFGEPADLVLGYHVAAVRETFEEAGLLLARSAGGAAGAGAGRPSAAPAPAALRAVHDGARADGTWTDRLAAGGLVLDLGALVPHARWVTPADAPKRFDACFFLARAPEGQEAAHDHVEAVEHCWITPADALARAAAGDMHLWFPTRETLRALARAGSVDQALDEARAASRTPILQPHFERGPDGWRVRYPGDPGYPHKRYAPGGAREAGGRP